jgi:hypothetical protein
MKKFVTRLRVAFKILFGRRKHWAMINISKENLVELLKGNEFDVDVFYHGIQPYVFYKLIKCVSNSKDDIDMMLDKAKFEAEAIAKNN